MRKYIIFISLIFSFVLTGCSTGEIPDEENLHPDGIVSVDDDGTTYGYAEGCDVYTPDITENHDVEYEEGCADWASGKIWLSSGYIEGVPTVTDLESFGFTTDSDISNLSDCIITFTNDAGDVLYAMFNEQGHISNLISYSKDITFVKGLDSNPSRSDIKKKLGIPSIYTRSTVGYMSYEYLDMSCKYILKFNTSDEGDLVETSYTFREVEQE